MGGIPGRVLAVLFLGILIASGIRLAVDFVNPTARFMDGSTIVDECAGQQVAVAGFTLPYLSPDSIGTIILQGVNYATGAILNETSQIIGEKLPMEKV
ncbi:hypothetical protein LINGRAHAP2_LOCUS6189 [Linum grandiflorum]